MGADDRIDQGAHAHWFVPTLPAADAGQLRRELQIVAALEQLGSAIKPDQQAKDRAKQQLMALMAAEAPTAGTPRGISIAS
ncbi:hypothetical protein [Pseudonocardia sp. GCM10023141]|uniref:hypothetical protein n=1 Tax=Pseudonocardia sp. GCM10023141 TaxID=3252653 RepID=UPI0036102528